MFVLGVIVFATASGLCGATPTGSLDEVWLITFRIIQGAGAAIMFPAALAIVLGAFPVRERGRAMAISSRSPVRRHRRSAGASGCRGGRQRRRLRAPWLGCDQGHNGGHKCGNESAAHAEKSKQDCVQATPNHFNSGLHRVESTVDLPEAPSYLVESFVDPIEAFVYLSKAFVDLPEAFVCTIEAFIDTFEAVVDAIEAFIDQATQAVQPVVCPTHSHRLHASNVPRSTAPVAR